MSAFGLARNPVDWERGEGQRLGCQLEQNERVVISGDSIAAELAAFAASMDDGPLALFTRPDCNRLHSRPAFGGSVSGFGIEVDGIEAVGTVIAMQGSGVLAGDDGMAIGTTKCGCFLIFVQVILMFGS